ncbi:polysaccharide deacetylase family protein [Bacillus sp. ISL-47]|uniref:polysaccharide deacetylase family protein n=1 Tax=Bacillus sp. ISL-47 TaxID=2819130 RepID=UPI001BE91E65|nr:polysaccharide deacetylase family protein [Bacillus sp. ISL-47]MBT2687862.1 polysaccharide deacetylase family protein [Bacillus sp. ISL-47]MBT2708061.1 polysaccharide deacetylase family protein [Pseudomonas sp. ISL-84]
MKKAGVMILFSFILFLSACGTVKKEEAATVKKEQEEIEEETEVSNSEQETNIQANEGSNNKEDNVNNETSQETVAAVETEYQLNENNWTIEPIKNANSKVVLLTIDDAPDTYALQMAEILKKLGAPAIFFVNGHFIDTPEEAAVLKAIHNLGFPIGNHTYSHQNLKDLSEEQQFKEIVGLNDEIEDIIGQRPKFFRAPFGSNTDYSKKIAQDEKMLVMNWTYGYDWEKEYQSKEALTDIMVNSPYLVEGANLLMHDRQWTKEALEDIVKGLQNKGYEMANPARIKTVQ